MKDVDKEIDNFLSDYLDSNKNIKFILEFNKSSVNNYSDLPSINIDEPIVKSEPHNVIVIKKSFKKGNKRSVI